MDYYNKTIILTGMMGSGKTTIGRNLASRLNLSFEDSDQYFVNATGHSIPEIFKRFGEKYFRDAEERIIKTIILEKRNKVLSVGGGAFINEKLRNFIINNSTSIWLDASFKTLFNRLKNNTKNRPLFEGYNFEDRLKHILKERTKYYKLAHIRVNVNNKLIPEIIDKILEYI
tara:strand:- start:341 stop:856 length:516 start_codon:yes stop_codon:yes gene_type:complete